MDSTPTALAPEPILRAALRVVHVAAYTTRNWTRQQPGLSIPIIGVRTAKQLKDNLECLDHPISEEHMKRLDEISKIELGFPHDMLNREFFQNLVYAGTYDKIDNHRSFR